MRGPRPVLARVTVYQPAVARQTAFSTTVPQCGFIYLKPWLILNALLAAVMLLTMLIVREKESKAPAIVCAITTLCTGLCGYWFMRDFYFP